MSIVQEGSDTGLAREKITPWMVFLLYTKMTMMGFGGTMFWVRRLLVQERRWVTEAEFAEYFAVAQLVPGGAALYNVTLMLGHHVAGVRGAVAAALGFIVIPFFVMVSVAMLYLKFGGQPIVSKALTGMFTVVVGLMMANAYGMAKAMPRRMRPWLFTLVAFAAIGVARWPLVSVMLVLAPFAVAAVWQEVKADKVDKAASTSAATSEGSK